MPMNFSHNLQERQHLCEALPYFNAYQSALSGRQGNIFGAMFDSQGGERDYMDEDILITRACVPLPNNCPPVQLTLGSDSGGGMKPVDGEYVQTEDQSGTGQHKNLVATKDLKYPIALIVGLCHPNPTNKVQMPMTNPSSGLRSEEWLLSHSCSSSLLRT